MEEKMGKLKQEVVEANKSENRLQKELQMSLGGWQGHQGNSWQVGVAMVPSVGEIWVG